MNYHQLVTIANFVHIEKQVERNFKPYIMPIKQSKSNFFTDKVKEVVKKIPKGKTMSYKEVAILAGNSKSARAVARIMSANYDPEVPCHRVIRSDGKLGGYNRGGEEAKRDILEAESR